MTRNILVTGGAGYIGSHTVIALIEAGFNAIVVDDLSNSCEEALTRIATITGTKPPLYQMDVADRIGLDRVFADHRIDAVMHFAGWKAVAESVANPLTYYRNNLATTMNLLETMEKHQVRRFVFSSSATVYGDPLELPLKETAPLSPLNPYGRTKWMIEQMLADLAATESGWHIAALRYFNPVGAHPSGMLGEDPQGIPNNLMPFISQVAVKRRPYLSIFGNDYPTPDGTCVRDYIHVVDLASGHLAALRHLDNINGWRPYNLGTGAGSSVLEVIAAFSDAAGFPIPHQFTTRRPGDSKASYACPERARRELGWEAQLDLPAMCADAWRWQRDNPQGLQAS